MRPEGRPSDSDFGLRINPLQKLKIKRSHIGSGDPQQPNLFDSESLAAEMAPYEVISPGKGPNEMSDNPALLAIGLKARRARSTNPRSLFRPMHGLTRPAGTQALNSLITKKPLSALKEPSTKRRQHFSPWEIEKKGLLFRDDPIAYFQKHKDGSGHRFIYLVYSRPPEDPLFSPYELLKVAQSDIGANYFLMTATGVTHTDEGGSEQLTLANWCREKQIFAAMHNMPTFRKYLFWKPFGLWKTYVMKQRYQRLCEEAASMPVIENHLIIEKTIRSVGFVQQCDDIVNEFLLSIYPQRKYTVDDYRRVCGQSLARLTQKYSEFVVQTAEQLAELYAAISDPALLVVSDAEFAEIHRKNPNVTQLAILENKKEQRRQKRADKMNRELVAFGRLIRLIDYLFLEAQRSCVFRGWKLADQNLSGEDSAIFTIDATFDLEGNVAFVPDVDGLIELLHDTLDNSIEAMNDLPRVFHCRELGPILTQRELAFHDAPSLREILRCIPDLQDLENHMIAVIKESYEDAERTSQGFKDYWPLFKLGQAWDVRNYIVTKDGQKYEGTLDFDERDVLEGFDDFLIHSETEPYVDFKQLRKDIAHLRAEEKRVSAVRAGAVSGPLSIDSRSLRGILTPIPKRSLEDIEKLLNKLIQFKIGLMNNVFKRYSKFSKIECLNLSVFVDFAALLKKIETLLPQMHQEITFVDSLIVLLEESGFGEQKNPLYETFTQFKLDLKMAGQISLSHYEKFAVLLKQMVGHQQAKLDRYLLRSSVVPKSVKDAVIGEMAELNEKIRAKLKKSKHPIRDLIRFQTILDFDVVSFGEYAKAKANVKFMDFLIHVLRVDELLRSRTYAVPFSDISISEFRRQFEEFSVSLQKLMSLWNRKSGILGELTEQRELIAPHVDSLELLQNGQMQLRHWQALFEECGKPGCYAPNQTIDDLRTIGILDHPSEIRRITNISLGEFKLEAKFRQISQHLEDVHLPIAESQSRGEADLTLGPLDSLLADLESSSVGLQTLLQNPFVEGIRSAVFALAMTLGRLISILHVWSPFQANWMVLSTLFQQEAIRNTLQSQLPRYQGVQRKWVAIVRHVLSNTRLLSVMKFQTLLEDLEESNEDLEAILVSLADYIDAKRRLLPRLYYLSNEEVLELVSATTFKAFSGHFTKLMMHIITLDSHFREAAEAALQDQSRELCNFNGLKIFALVGEDGDTLSLTPSVMCTGPLENWVPKVYDSLTSTFRNVLAESIASYARTSLNDWILPVSSYVGVITLQVMFARTVQDSFDSLETNPRVFIVLEAVLKNKLNDLMLLLHSPLTHHDLHKILNGIVLMN
jgi:hypothetical protein